MKNFSPRLTPHSRTSKKIWTIAALMLLILLTLPGNTKLLATKKTQTQAQLEKERLEKENLELKNKNLEAKIALNTAKTNQLKIEEKTIAEEKIAKEAKEKEAEKKAAEKKAAEEKEAKSPWNRAKKVNKVAATSTKWIGGLGFAGLVGWGMWSGIQQGKDAEKDHTNKVQDLIQRQVVEDERKRLFSSAAEDTPPELLAAMGEGIDPEILANRPAFFINLQPYNDELKPEELAMHEVVYLRTYHLAQNTGQQEGQQEGTDSQSPASPTAPSSGVGPKAPGSSNQDAGNKDVSNTKTESVKLEGPLAEIMGLPQPRPKPSLESLNLTYQSLEEAKKDLASKPSNVSQEEEENRKELIAAIELAQKEILAQKKLFYPTKQIVTKPIKNVKDQPVAPVVKRPVLTLKPSGDEIKKESVAP